MWALQPALFLMVVHFCFNTFADDRIIFPDSVEKNNGSPRKKPDKVASRMNSLDFGNYDNNRGQKVEEFHFGHKPEYPRGQELEDFHFGKTHEEDKDQQMEEFHFGPRPGYHKGQEVEEINFGEKPDHPKGQEVEEINFGEKPDHPKGQEVEEINFGEKPDHPKGQEVEEFHFGPKPGDHKGQEVEEINFGEKQDHPKGQEVEEFHFGPKPGDHKGQEVEEINFGEKPDHPKGQEVEEINFGEKPDHPKGQEVEEINFGEKPDHPKGQEMEEINFGEKPDHPKGQEVEEFHFGPKPGDHKGQEVEEINFGEKPDHPKGQEVEEINFGHNPAEPKEQEEVNFAYKPEDPKGQETEYHFVPKPDQDNRQEVEEINFGHKPEDQKGQDNEEYHIVSKPKEPKGQEPEETNFVSPIEEPKGQEAEEHHSVPNPDIDKGQEETEDFPFDSSPKEPKGNWFDIFLPSPAEEGCQAKPKPLMNSRMTCTPHRKCKVTCIEGYQLPDGSNQLTITCEDGKWMSEKDNSECKPVCVPPCQNDGVCFAPNQCACSENFQGSHCQYRNQPCISRPPVAQNSQVHCNASNCKVECFHTYSFPDGSSSTTLECHEGQWVLTRTDWNALPDCKPSCQPPCINGGSCLDYNKCQCPPQYAGPQCQYEINVCSGDKLHFNGLYTCKGTLDNVSCTLQCPDGYGTDIPLASEYICEYPIGKFQPEPIPKCVYGDNVEVIKMTSSSHTVYNISDNQPPEKGECVAWRGTHYKNFDGKVFSFTGDCSYTLVQDNTFRIVVDNSKCMENMCPNSLIIFYQDKEYEIDYHGNLSVNGISHPIPTQIYGILIQKEGNSVSVSLETLDVDLILSQGRYSVLVPANLRNGTSGLCGNFNDDPHDDLRTPDGTQVWNLEAFVQSWVNDPYTCQTSCNTDNLCADDSAVDYCRKIFMHPHFERCVSQLGKLKSYQDACEWDACKCGQSCACDTISEFANKCRKYLANEGFPDSAADWRQISECPWVCPPGKVYSSCGPTIEPRCGSLGVSDGLVKYSKCSEGCFCPEGMVLLNDSCVKKEQCHCQWRNIKYGSGESITKDCNTCTCQHGEWICTDLKCDARCSVTGGVHYLTFDGRRYDFSGRCSYYLLKSDNYSVESETSPCWDYDLFGELCGKSLRVRYGADEIKLQNHDGVSVNGDQVSSLPTEVNGIVIRSASHLYLTVLLPDDIEIWWDGNSNLYIDIPGHHEGSTGGLCGTFNNNQKDEFKTPEGDTEQSAVAFAEKWKTNETCSEEIDPYKPHICDSSIKRKELAEQYCRQLKEEVFRACHPHVDVDPFYKNCLHDVCSCQKDAKRCFCSILSDYGNECARRNVPIPWRNEIRECGVHCPPGQIYQPCGDKCGRSCQDIQLMKGHCGKNCAEGCSCPDGLVLNSQDQCVPVSNCNCIHQNSEYKPRHHIIMESSNGPQFCICENALWSCRPATKLEIDREYENSDFKCNETLHEEYTTCEPAEPKTCKNMHEKPRASSRICFPGCVCKKGYVWDSIGKMCVNASECPCHHGGKSYSDGEKIQEDCNTCICKNGRWECTERDCASICSSWGDSHFKTFDGRLYDFQGSCEFVLVAGSVSESESFMISLQIVPCGSTGISCPKSVSLKVGSPPKEEEIVLRATKPSSIPQDLERILVREAGLFLFVEVPDLGITIQWDHGTRVYVRADSKWKNRVKGLCGNFNDNELDDFKTPTSGETSEISAVLFANSWRLHSYCPDSLEIPDTCGRRPHRKPWSIRKCSIIKSETFERCHSEVPFEPFLEKCIVDACGCDEGGDCECMCTAISAYAEECTLRGIPIKWRTQKFCGLQCEANTVYSACVSACPRKSCENQFTHAALVQTCSEESCVEGCERPACPPGHVLADASSNRCVPISSCKTVCMTVNNVTYLEGDLMESDDCHSCFCSHHRKICKGKACALVSESFTTTTTPIPQPSSACPPGQVWDDCIVKCSHLCQHLEAKMSQENIPCSSEDACIAGCRAADLDCPSGMFLRDESTCVHEKDCPCLSSTNVVVKPGDVLQETECKKCQCVDNEYECTFVCSPTYSYNSHKLYTVTPGMDFGHEGNVTLIFHTTVPPPVFCPTGQFESLIDDFTKFSASSQKTEDSSAEHCRMNDTPGAWSAGMDNADQYLEINLGRVEPIYAVNVAGASGNYVTGYHLLYSVNGYKFMDVINQDGKKEVFAGPYEGHPSMKQVLPTVIEAKFVRFHPISWHGGISMKVDLLGCKESPLPSSPHPKICNKPIGIGQKYYPGLQITATSSRPDSSPDFIGFDNERGWQPLTNSKSEWIQMSFNDFVNFTGVITKGVSHGNESWVERYKVQYSPDAHGFTWLPVLDEFGHEMIFMGNLDGENEKKNFFKRPIHAKSLKIIPVKWHKNIALRLDVMGCYEPPRFETQVTPPAPLPKNECNICKGAMHDEEHCKCTGEEWWDGERCVAHSECPCFAGLIAYPVGTSFTTEKCQECICRLYGTPHCEPKHCDDCPPGLQKVFTPLCGCTCKPCENNTRLCPTSNVCVLETSWCDGVEDCPDDELNCTTPEPTKIVPTPKPCPVSCPPGYEVVYSNKTAGPSENDHVPRVHKVKSLKSVKTSKKRKKSRRPEKMTLCPPYDCVPIEEVTPTECPPPECPLEYSIIYKKNVKGLEGSCPLYACKPVPEYANCSVSSKNIKTFDGTEYKYDICDHVLARHDSGLWNITMLKNCNLASPCDSSLLIHHDEHTLLLHSHNRSIVLDSYVYSDSQLELLNSKMMDFTVSPIGNSIIFKSDTYGFELVFETNGNVRLTVSGEMKNHLNGLCGLYNGHPHDDKTMPDGRLSKTTADFGSSWLNPGGKECVEVVCPTEMQNLALEICRILRKEPFTSCSKDINLEPCIESTCNCLTGGYTAEECRCQTLADYATKCKSPDLFGWRWELGCPSSCPPNLVHYDCYPYACQPTCGNEECTEPSIDCYSGCFCPDGLVKRGDQCIQVQECRDCVCSGMGDSTYLTFDGGLTFNGNCTYVATREKNPSGTPAFEVLISNGLCNGSDFMTCTEKVEIKLPEHSIKLIALPGTEEKVKVLIDGVPHNLTKEEMERSWAKVNLDPETASVQVELPKEHVDVRFFYTRFAFTISLPSHHYSEKVEGLCGSCSQRVVEPDEMDNPEIWQTGKDENCLIEPPTQCVPTPEHEKLCLYMNDTKVFGKCLAFVDPTLFIDQCLTLLCLNEHVCNSLEAYGQACRDVGICVDWRSPTFCPFTCPADLEYQACKSGCHKTCDNFEEPSSSCLKPPVEGCFCPDGQVLINGECKHEKYCEYCDEEGQHYEGDFWQVDKCTNCSCKDHVVTCDKTECPPVELTCGEDQELALEENDQECCPRHKCVCKHHEACPELEISDHPLPVGMEAVVNNSGCCPRVEIVCRKENCPEINSCRPPYVQKIINSTACCPEHVCEKPDDVCLYALRRTSSEEHKITEREAKEELVKEVGDRWKDGPCKTCVCMMKDNQAEVVCTLTECPSLEDHQDFHEYALVHLNHSEKCCPEVVRKSCKHKGHIYQVGDSWMPDENNPCETLKCNDLDGLVVKEKRVEVCNTDCEQGWEYKQLEGHCCGHCVQVGCVVEDNLFRDGESWFSPDKCSKSTCVKHGSQFTITTMTESCPALDECPKEDIYRDGCCFKCKIRHEDKRNCLVEVLKPKETIKMIQEHKGPHGLCVNHHPINFTRCFGNCDSFTFYKPEAGVHESVCKCCRPQELTILMVDLQCEDGLKVTKSVTMPSKCSCNPCGP